MSNGRRPAAAFPQDVEVRHVALIGHRAAGATTLAETLLAEAGVVRQAGSVDAGTTLLDFDPESHARREGVMPGWAWLPVASPDAPETVLFLTDTPGSDAAFAASQAAARGADLCIVVVSAVDGIEHGAERALADARARGVPAMVVVTKADRLSGPGELSRRVEDIARTAGAVSGRTAVDLSCAGPSGWTHALDPDAPDAAREAAGEAVAMLDDALLERWVDQGGLQVTDIAPALAAAVAARRALPVFVVSGCTGEGVPALLPWLARLAPAPTGDPTAPVVLRRIGTSLGDDDVPVAVFRVEQGTLSHGVTLHETARGAPVKVARWYALRGPRRSKARHVGPGAVIATWEDVPGVPGSVLAQAPQQAPAAWPAPSKMAWLHLALPATDAVPPGAGRVRRAVEERLTLLAAMDPALSWLPEGDGIRLAGATPDALDRVVERLQQRWGLPVEAGPPPVRYLERPRTGAAAVRRRHERRHGDDVLEFGEVELTIEPVDPDSPFEFEMCCDDEDVPVRFHAAVGEGAARALASGPTAGFPVCGVRARCTGGEYDVFGSEAEHFALAGEVAMRDALAFAGTEILEPWQEVRVHAPARDTGPVLSDLAARRARVVGMEVDGDTTTIVAECPEREVVTLAVRLRGLTHGRGWFEPSRRRYQPVPAGVAIGIGAHGGDAVGTSGGVRLGRQVAR